MIKIENRQRGPVQLVVKSETKPRSMSVLNIPGVGSDDNIRYLRDELTTEFVERAEKKFGLIKTTYIPDSEYKNTKGD